MIRALALIAALMAPLEAGAQTVNFGNQSGGDPTVLPAENSGSAKLAVGQQAITATAARVVAARRYRNNVVVENLSANAIYCGPDNTVTVTTGHLLPGAIGAAIRFDYDGDVWCVSASASTVSFAEIYP